MGIQSSFFGPVYCSNQPSGTQYIKHAKSSEFPHCFPILSMGFGSKFQPPGGCGGPGHRPHREHLRGGLRALRPPGGAPGFHGELRRRMAIHGVAGDAWTKVLVGVIYPLVNVPETMENHHAMKIGKSTISTGPCSRVFCRFTRG